VHATSVTAWEPAVNPATPWSDPEGVPDRSGMSLMAAASGPWDHRGIAESPDPGTRPLADGGGPTELSRDAPRRCGPPGAGWSWSDGGWAHHDGAWAGRRDHHRHHVGRKLKSLRRSPDNRVLGGVCGAVSRATGIDATWVRIGFVLLAVMSGVMVFVYAMAWLLIPMEGESSNIASRAVADRHGLRVVAAVLIPLLIAVSIITSTLHVAFVGFIGWPTILAVGVVVLIWRNANESEKAFIDNDVVPLLGGDTHGKGRRWLIARVVVGVLIAAGGIVLLVEGHTTVAALRPVGGAALVIAACVVIFGPWWLSLVRDLIAERQARALAEERAQMAAHVHDSVLQTLALIQRSADDPQNVVRLARAQERELRAWLFEGKPPGAIGEDATRLAEGVGLLQRQVEADHGIAVQVVLVGDCELDEPLRALLDAAREATVNAAKWSEADQVSVYAEVEPDTVMLYVRDRGRGFDPDSVPVDRQGIAQSIRARVARYGGSAVVRSAPGEGAEVQLSMPRRERVR
jgi:signal transduction histidine kinase